LAKPAGTPISFVVRYDGVGPVHWSGGPDDFGLQDKAGLLHPGGLGADSVVSFAFSLEVKDDDAVAPNFLGDFAHGPRNDRFLYLGWRNRTGEFAQRLKLPLNAIGWDAVRRARETGEALSCVLVDKNPKATSTGANIGGTRPVEWAVG
jgi:hypothetical protein